MGLADTEENAPDYEAYLTYRRYLVELHLESARGFDRIVGALSGGALAISITFVDRLVEDATRHWLLFASWCALAFCLLTNLLSTYAAERDYFHSIGAVDEAFEEDRFPDDIGRMSRFEKWVPGLNLVALIAFIVGLGFLIAFAGMNLGATD